MSFSMYLRIPGITGGSTGVGYEGSLDVLAYSWGASTSQTALGSAGKASVSDLSVTSYLDTASSPLLMDLLKGTHLKSATLSVVPAPPSQPDVYTLSNVIVNALSLGGSGGEDRLTINLSLNFGALNFLVQGKRATWDLATNTPGSPG